MSDANELDFLGGDAAPATPEPKPRARKKADSEPEIVAAKSVPEVPAIPEMEVEILRKYVPIKIKTADGDWIDNHFDPIVGAHTEVKPGTPSAPTLVTLQMNEAIRAVRAGVAQPVADFG